MSGLVSLIDTLYTLTFNPIMLLASALVGIGVIIYAIFKYEGNISLYAVMWITAIAIHTFQAMRVAPSLSAGIDLFASVLMLTGTFAVSSIATKLVFWKSYSINEQVWAWQAICFVSILLTLTWTEADIVQAPSLSSQMVSLFISYALAPLVVMFIRRYKRRNALN